MRYRQWSLYCFLPILFVVLVHSLFADEAQELMGMLVGASNDGVRVVFVDPEGPAGKSGISAGSVIAAIDGKKTPAAADLMKALAEVKGGAEIAVETISDKRSATVTVKTWESIADLATVKISDEEQKRLTALVAQLGELWRKVAQATSIDPRDPVAHKTIVTLVRDHFPLVVRGLHSDNQPGARRTIIGALTYADTGRAAVALSYALQDSEPSLRNNAGFGLLRLASPLTDVKALIALAKDTSALNKGEPRSKAPVTMNSILKRNTEGVSREYARLLIDAGALPALAALRRDTSSAFAPGNAKIALETIARFYPDEVKKAQ